MMQNNWKGYIMKCKKNKLIKKVFIIFSALIFLIIFLWTIMQINTNSVLEDVKNAIYCKDYYIPNNLKESNEMKKIISENKDVNFIFYDEDEYETSLYARLNLPHKYNIIHIEQYNIEFNLKRNYTVHNFKDGFIWLNCSLSINPKDKGNCDKPNIKSSSNFLIKLKIKKINKSWTIIDIWIVDHWCSEQMEHDYWFTSKMY